MKTVGLALILCGALLAQDSGSFTVPFSDPSRPKTLQASLENACIAVTGYDGREVVVESSPRETRSSRRRNGPAGAEGLRRLDIGHGDINIEESGNTVKITGSGNGHLVLKVPMDTTVKVECVNGGDLRVEHLSGNVELSNTNGKVFATGMSGPVIAHSQNGKVVVTLDRVTPDKAMSLTSYNGDVDVTMPGDAKVTVRMGSYNGDVFTDFDTKLSPSSSNVVKESREGGRYKVKVERATVGTINGGGTDMTLKSYNGNIFIRKKQ